ncbi:MAG: NADP-dependent oxidoreductase [Desulfatitalea sp.]|nr:NADP-dependent oxidoreductase [Desulfatitalea sp.]NNK00746.1 NADP-dependent oxidoreductase [Desulfatitalea sp.]
MTEDNFELAVVQVPSPAQGEFLVKNLWLSIEAGIRTMMHEPDVEASKSTIPLLQKGEPVHSFTVGQIIQSRHPRFPKGSYVTGLCNWQEYFISDGARMQIVDADLAPVRYYLGIMGAMAAPAYFGLLDVGKITDGETVVVSAAAGSIGSVACQVAKLTGCRVVGITGSDEKVDWLVNELGIDAAVNYKKADNLQDCLKSACSGGGIDVFFDSVAGKSLEAVIDVMKVHGRILAYGALHGYDGGDSVWPTNYLKIIYKRLCVKGLSSLDYLNRLPEYHAQMSRWISEGKVRWRETVYEGIENAVPAWIGLFQGKNIGKMLVKLGDPEQIP